MIEFIIDKRVTSKSEIESFAAKLMAAYPLLNTSKLTIRIEKTKNNKLKGECIRVPRGVKTDVVSYIYIREPKEVTELYLLGVVAHEYHHAMQNDTQSDPQAAGKGMRELQADMFAIKAMKEFYHNCVEEWIPVYPQTKVYLKETPKELWYANLPVL